MGERQSSALVLEAGQSAKLFSHYSPQLFRALCALNIQLFAYRPQYILLKPKVRGMPWFGLRFYHVQMKIIYVCWIIGGLSIIIPSILAIFSPPLAIEAVLTMTITWLWYTLTICVHIMYLLLHVESHASYVLCSLNFVCWNDLALMLSTSPLEDCRSFVVSGHPSESSQS